ncbi:hypothetical protein AB0B28_06435 [Glycomyces sp. NPDC046736]|uniref:hypothetical protein n=1 Tax=Glycomyces sp. NPDC046736 TaxID=3155615 RepID=UPI0033E5578D
MTDLLNQMEWPHASRMTATICETEWDTLLETLSRFDGYLRWDLMAASARLHLADARLQIALTEAALKSFRTTGTLVEQLPKAQRHQFAEAEEAVSTCGYLHPSRVDLLAEPIRRAMEQRHEARGALGDLLFQARSVLEDA